MISVSVGRYILFFICFFYISYLLFFFLSQPFGYFRNLHPCLFWLFVSLFLFILFLFLLVFFCLNFLSDMSHYFYLRSVLSTVLVFISFFCVLSGFLFVFKNFYQNLTFLHFHYLLCCSHYCLSFKFKSY